MIAGASTNAPAGGGPMKDDLWPLVRFLHVLGRRAGSAG